MYVYEWFTPLVNPTGTLLEKSRERLRQRRSHETKTLILTKSEGDKSQDKGI